MDTYTCEIQTCIPHVRRSSRTDLHHTCKCISWGEAKQSKAKQRQSKAKQNTEKQIKTKQCKTKQSTEHDQSSFSVSQHHANGEGGRHEIIAFGPHCIHAYIHTHAASSHAFHQHDANHTPTYATHSIASLGTRAEPWHMNYESIARTFKHCPLPPPHPLPCFRETCLSA